MIFNGVVRVTAKERQKKVPNIIKVLGSPYDKDQGLCWGPYLWKPSKGSIVNSSVI